VYTNQGGQLLAFAMVWGLLSSDTVAAIYIERLGAMQGLRRFACNLD